MRKETRKATGWTIGLFVALAALFAVAYATGNIDLGAAT
jgi:hypothetical protein